MHPYSGMARLVVLSWLVRRETVVGEAFRRVLSSTERQGGVVIP